MPLHVPTRPQSPEKYEVYIGDLAAWLSLGNHKSDVLQNHRLTKPEYPENG